MMFFGVLAFDFKSSLSKNLKFFARGKDSILFKIALEIVPIFRFFHINP